MTDLIYYEPSKGNKVPRDEKPKPSKGELKMSLLEVAERKGDIPNHIKYLDVYSYLLNTFESRGKWVSGYDFAEKIRHAHYTGDDTPEGRRNALMEDVAEKYVIAVKVKADGSTTFKLPKALAESLAA